MCVCVCVRERERERGVRRKMVFVSGWVGERAVTLILSRLKESMIRRWARLVGDDDENGIVGVHLPTYHHNKTSARY